METKSRRALRELREIVPRYKRSLPNKSSVRCKVRWRLDGDLRGQAGRALGFELSFWHLEHLDLLGDPRALGDLGARSGLGVWHLDLSHRRPLLLRDRRIESNRMRSLWEVFESFLYFSLLNLKADWKPVLVTGLGNSPCSAVKHMVLATFRL